MRTPCAAWLALCGTALVIAPLQAQEDTSAAIRLGVRGASAAQPGLVVLAGPGLDSVRMIVQRDLENSNRFTMPHLLDSAGTLHGPFDPNSLKNFGLSFAVELEPAINGVDIKLYNLASGTIAQQATRAVEPSGVGDSRMTIHQISDQIVGWTGGIGVAATRIAFKLKSGKDDAIYRIDADGANMVRIASGGGYYMTPAWSPDDASLTYSAWRDGRWTLYLQKLASDTRTAVPTSSPGNSYGANFSPDGKSLAFTHNVEKGSDIESVDISRMCCAHQLTREGSRALALNVSPTYSPDGRRIAFNSDRTGTPEIWVMDNDGTSAQQLVPSDFEGGDRPLDSYAPAWSPDGSRLLFDRDTPSGGRQLYSYSFGSGQVVQLTSVGRNDDPSWAPDSRHVVFKSTRSGKEQLWVLDIESAATRQLPTPGGAQYPAWSHNFGTNP